MAGAKKIYVPIILLIIMVFTSTISFLNHHYVQNRISSNVYFKDINLGGKSYNETDEIISSLQFTFLGPEGDIISIPLRKMGVILNNTQIFQTGCHLSPSKSWFQERILAKKEKVFIHFEYQLDQKRLSQSLSSLVEHFSRKPENAYVSVNTNNQVEMIPERYGYQVNRNDIQQAIIENLSRPDAPLLVNIPVTRKIRPEITISTLEDQGIKNLMVCFSTTFDPTLKTRVHNIKLAAANINNCFLAPGEVFSVNRTLGNPTSEKGYQSANVIVGGELVPGIGGGVCQISSTLYNAALLADLEILERYSHQLTVPYIDPGRDATVSYPCKDLSFRNNKNHYILIKAGVKKDKLTISFLGQPLNERVQIKTKTLKTYPPPQNLSLKSREKLIGYPGYLVEVWKVVYRGEKKVEEEKISVDKYAPFRLKQSKGH